MAVAPARPGRPLRNGRLLASLALVGLVLSGMVVALVGCSSADDDSDAIGDTATQSLGGDAAVNTTTTLAVEAFAQEAKSANDAGAPSSGAGAARSVPSFERIVRTAEIRLVVKGNVAGAADRAAVLASSLGGFVADSSTSTGGRSASAALTLRVPVDRFDDARRRLADLGRVEGTDLSGEDVGGQLVDLDARLRSLRAEEAALDTLLGRAGDIGQILQVRDRITGVRTEIEQLAGQQAALQDRAALATIHVSVRKAGAPAPREDGEDDSLADSLRTAVDATEAVIGGMVVVIGALVPFLLVALLAWPVAVWVRRRFYGNKV